MSRAHGACEAKARSKEESDAGASPTTSDAAYVRNPHAPGGFRRRGAVCFVAAPRRCAAPDFVAAPRIRPRGVRNATRPQYPDRLLERDALGRDHAVDRS